MQKKSPYPVVYEDTTIIRLRPAPRAPGAAEVVEAPTPPPRAAAAAAPGARKRVVPPRWTVAGSLAALLALLAILAARSGTHSALTQPVPATPAHEPHEAPSVVRPADSTDSLRELLATPITQELVQVEPEPSGGVLLTLTLPDLFDSGRQNVNPRYVGLIHTIGAALQKVSGHFLVIGHTDDQRIHSARFPDNVALSLERARQVAQLMKDEIGDSGRVDVRGMGSRQPLHLPASLPMNRARNRRIEIAVQSGG